MVGCTRRQFLADSAMVLAGVSVASCFPDVGGDWPVECVDYQDNTLTGPVSGSARVIEVLDPSSVTEHSEIVADKVFPMLEQALSSLADHSDPWSVLLPEYQAGMRIGLKVNCLNPSCPTSVPLVRAIVDSLKAGLNATGADILVWDRRLDELFNCGFTNESTGATVIGTENSTTDANGPGYEECFCEVLGGKRTRLSRIITELTDLTLNVPVLKTHEVSGVTASLKNIYGIIDNPGSFHADLATALPALYALAPIRRSIKLIVVDALVAVTVGGTASPTDTTPKRIFVARDPLAADLYALDLVNKMREEKRALGIQVTNVDGKSLTWLDNAYALGLGTNTYDLTTIER